MPPSRCRGLLLSVVVSSAMIGCTPAGHDLGESIYQAGEGAHGTLSFRRGPPWLSRTTAGCAVCHGRRGEGRTVRAGTASGSAPPLTASALASRGYDAAGLRRAITEGVGPGGRRLADYMPRWELDEVELEALLTYLQTL